MLEPQNPRVVALLTCFNRKSQTLQCLQALEAAGREARVHLEAILVDDASTDGTPAAVKAAFPWVDVVRGSGSLFWNRGMHEAFARGLQRDADYYLWLNDDTDLVSGALKTLIAQGRYLTGKDGQPVIVVGATADRATQQVTYGGRRARSRLKRFTYELVWDSHEPVPCDVIEGNCVLIPRAVARKVGNLDPVFEHAMGDTDYALRARRVGVRAYVVPGIMGYCSVNPLRGTYFDRSLPLRQRWQLIRGRKGLPVRSWLRFTRRHGGFLWPVYFLWPYVKVVLTYK
jgi:GT2 family glycosyltransferase